MKKMLRGVSLLLILLLFAPVAAAEDEVWMARADGVIRIAPDGSVAEFRLNQSVDGQVDDLIQRQVDAWRFEPVIEDGQAIEVRANVSLELHARPSGSRMQVHVADARFVERAANAPSSSRHARRRVVQKPPRYPRRAAGAGMMADVDLILDVARDGSVLRTAVERTRLLSTASHREAGRKRMAESFEKSALAVTPDWIFETAGLDFGNDEYAQIRVPVIFALNNVTWGRLHEIEQPALAGTGQRDGAPAITELDASGRQASPRIALLTQLQPASGG